MQQKLLQLFEAHLGFLFLEPTKPMGDQYIKEILQEGLSVNLNGMEVLECFFFNGGVWS